MLRLMDNNEQLCFRDFWNEETQKLSFQVKAVELSDTQKKWIGSSSDVFSAEYEIQNCDTEFPDSKSIFFELKSYEENFFAQIGSRSWRQRILKGSASIENYFIYKFRQNHTGRSLYLHYSIKKDYPISCYFYAEETVSPWSEFRFFIRDCKVIGVSQYHHQEAYPEIQENIEAIKASLIPFSHQLIDALHMDTVVADVFVEKQNDGHFKTTLIELNPFIHRTDPCLYSWQNGGDFDGSIRYRKLRYNPYRNTTHAGQASEELGLFREEDYRRS